MVTCAENYIQEYQHLQTQTLIDEVEYLTKYIQRYQTIIGSEDQKRLDAMLKLIASREAAVDKEKR